MFSFFPLVGASHLEELRMLFQARLPDMFMEPIKNGTSDYRLMEQMVDMWTNFATTGYAYDIKKKIYFISLCMVSISDDKRMLEQIRTISFFVNIFQCYIVFVYVQYNVSSLLVTC